MFQKNIALIMARGGSKSIPLKNIVRVHGHPLIAWSIAACKLSKKIDEVIVSTDSRRIAKIAQKYGALIPFLRPKKYSSDHSTDLDVFKHFVSWYSNNRRNDLKMIIHIRPTTPFRDPKIIDKAIMLFEKKFNSLTSLRSVYEISETSWKHFEKTNKGLLKSLIDIVKNKEKNSELSNLPRQKLPKTFFGQGYVDIVKPSIIKKNMTYGNKSYGFLTKDIGEIDNKNQLKTINSQKLVEGKVLLKYLKKYERSYKKRA